MATALIRTTFALYTHESIENGDCEESGFVDESGEQYTLSEALRLLAGCEPSSSSFHTGVWYTDTNYHECMRTGDKEECSYHLTASVGFQRRLFAILTRKRGVGVLASLRA